ncbi:hypothetical protein HGR_05946 [Hylemonella gracilis ATCC 19624]|uniref:Uncharacterized protein n=1 Tax=Hylemonella gracilis ATCC 19624 TaxID=887062 RepID=F3KRW0_9BURK|nr:hypothetical protein HGR_05946 [Hylemonella gracilis ATCC 19624]
MWFKVAPDFQQRVGVEPPRLRVVFDAEHEAAALLQFLDVSAMHQTWAEVARAEIALRQRDALGEDGAHGRENFHVGASPAQDLPSCGCG